MYIILRWEGKRLLIVLVIGEVILVKNYLYVESYLR